MAKAEETKAKYATLKTDYEAKIKATEASTSNYKLILRNRLFGEGKVGADIGNKPKGFKQRCHVFQKFYFGNFKSYVNKPG